MRIGLLLIVLSLYTSLSVSAVRTWRSDAAVWAHAYRVAPASPRTAINYAKTLFAAGDEAAALRIAGGITP